MVMLPKSPGKLSFAENDSNVTLTILYRLEYIIIVFSFVYQIFLFDDIPNELEIIGLIFVILACFLSLSEELYYHLKDKGARYDAVANNSDSSSSESDIDIESNLVSMSGDENKMFIGDKLNLIT